MSVTGEAQGFIRPDENDTAIARDISVITKSTQSTRTATKGSTEEQATAVSAMELAYSRLSDRLSRLGSSKDDASQSQTDHSGSQSSRG